MYTLFFRFKIPSSLSHNRSMNVDSNFSHNFDCSSCSVPFPASVWIVSEKSFEIFFLCSYFHSINPSATSMCNPYLFHTSLLNYNPSHATGTFQTISYPIHATGTFQTISYPILSHPIHATGTFKMISHTIPSMPQEPTSMDQALHHRHG